LCEIHRLITELIQEYRPRAVALESVFAALNVKAALRLAEVRGVVLLAAAQAKVPAFSYSPRKIKATVASYGHASKEQVQQMVRALLSMSETPEPADAADALAVALCHIHLSEVQVPFAGQRIFRKPAVRQSNRGWVTRIPSLS
jgi:crossover junction endodeoxyribonuclease RuvC